jgi:hypothetical protein
VLENGAEALLTKPIGFGTLRSEIDTETRQSFSLSPGRTPLAQVSET